MGILYDLFKVIIVISILSLIHHGLSTQSIAKKASEAHIKDLTSYGNLVLKVINCDPFTTEEIIRLISNKIKPCSFIHLWKNRLLY